MWWSQEVLSLSSVGLQTCYHWSFPSSTFDHSIDKMSSKSHGVSACPGTVLAVFSLLLYSAGFIRIEVKFNDHEERLLAAEEVISRLKLGMTDTSIKGKVCFDIFPLNIGVSSVAFVFCIE